MSPEALPRYALEFEEYDPLKQREIYARLGLSDQTAERLFRLLCAAVVEQKSPAVPLSSLLERALRWAAHPEHHRLQPRFPRAQSVIEDRVRDFVLKAVDSGICALEEGGRVIRLYPLERVKERALQARLDAVTASLQQAYADAVLDTSLSFPGPEMLDQDAQRLSRRKLSWKEFNQSLITEQGSELYEINFPFSREPVVLTRALVLDLKKACINRLISHVRKLVGQMTEDLTNAALNRTNYMLKDSFPSPEPAHQITLEKLVQGLAGEAPRFEGRFDVWAAVARKLLDEADRVRDESDGMVSLRQSLALLFSWFSYARDMELKIRNGEQLLMDIYSQVSAFPRTFSFLEIRNRPLSVQYIGKYGEEDYGALFKRFVRENDFKAPGTIMAESVITLTPENDGAALLHVGQAAEFLQRRLDAARDKRLGLVTQEYVLPLQALLRRDHYDERAAGIFKSEELFLADLEKAFGRRFPYLAAVLEVCADSPDLIIHILERAGVPLNRFFTSEGALKPPAALLRADRIKIMKQLSRSVSFWQRMVIRFMRFFHRSDGDGRSLWPVLLGSLHHSHREKQAADTRRPVARPAEPVQVAAEEQKAEYVRKKPDAPLKVSAEEMYKGKKEPSRTEAPPRKPRKSKKGGAAITKRNSKALAAAFSGGHDRSWFLAKLAVSMGMPEDRAREFADRIIGERVTFTLDSVTVENLEEIAGHIASDPRLDGFTNREALVKYVILSILERFR